MRERLLGFSAPLLCRAHARGLARRGERMHRQRSVMTCGGEVPNYGQASALNATDRRLPIGWSVLRRRLQCSVAHSDVISVPHTPGRTTVYRTCCAKNARAFSKKRGSALVHFRVTVSVRPRAAWACARRTAARCALAVAHRHTHTRNFPKLRVKYPPRQFAQWDRDDPAHAFGTACGRSTVSQLPHTRPPAADHTPTATPPTSVTAHRTRLPSASRHGPWRWSGGRI